MNSQEQIIYKPLNYESALKLDSSKNNRKVLVNKEQNVADVITKGEHIDIPYLYKEQTPCYHEKKDNEKQEFSEGFKPLKNVILSKDEPQLNINQYQKLYLMEFPILTQIPDLTLRILILW